MLEKNREPNKHIIFFFVAIGIFMSTLDGSIVNIALPTIMKDFNTSLSTVKWVMIIYLLTVSSLLLSFGRLSDINGRRLIYGSGLVIFSAGSLFCAISASAGFLIVARAFQGLGAAMIMSCTPALIVDTFPGPERGKYLGMIGAVVASGLTLGPAIGGFLLHHFSWRSIFYINLPIGITAAILILVYLKGSQSDVRSKEPFDWVGSICLVISISGFILVISNGYNWGIVSFPFISITLVVMIAAGCLVAIEARFSFPVLNMNLFKIRLFGFPVMAAITLFGALFTMIFLMPFYLMVQLKLPSFQAGNMMVIPFIFLFLIAPVSGSLSDKIGTRFLCTAGMGLMMTALFLLSQLPPDATLIDVGWRMAIAGMGTAIFSSPNTSAAMGAVPGNRRGIAGGIVAAARNLGMVVGVSMAGAIFNYMFDLLTHGETLNTYRPELEFAFMRAFSLAMAAGAVMAGIGMVVAFLRGAER
ncbi:MAG: MFS transporter [Proteobacteria bacterium]|nr:MFS transporter [Pseudomonadota bacterium]